MMADFRQFLAQILVSKFLFVVKMKPKIRALLSLCQIFESIGSSAVFEAKRVARPGAVLHFMPTDTIAKLVDRLPIENPTAGTVVAWIDVLAIPAVLTAGFIGAFHPSIRMIRWLESLHPSG